MHKVSLALLLVVLSACGCRRTDVRDFVIEVPALTAENAAAVTRPLSAFEGFDAKSLKVDAAAHRISLRYDSMKVAKKNLEMAIAQAGYEANGVTPESVGAKRAK